jgi:hypothetical protein
MINTAKARLDAIRRKNKEAAQAQAATPTLEEILAPPVTKGQTIEEIMARPVNP